MGRVFRLSCGRVSFVLVEQMNIMNIIKQPSSWGGLGLVFSGIAALVASKGQDQTGWAQVMTGAAAIVLPERGASR